MDIKKSPWGITDIWQDVVRDPEGIEQASMINRDTGERYLSHSKLDKLPKEWQYVIKKHEEGHYCLQTDYPRGQDLINEKLADTYAFYEYVQKYDSLTNFIDAISYMLACNQNEAGANPDHDERVRWAMQLCKNYDYYVNGNERAKM